MKNLLLILLVVPFLSTFAKLEVGKTAPEFSLKDNFGRTYNLKDMKEKIVVLEWYNPGCPFSERHAKAKTINKIKEKYGKDVEFIGIDSSNKNAMWAQGEYDKWIADTPVNYPILKDQPGKVGRAYEAKTTPHIFIINKGKLVYHGAIDNDKFGDKPANKKMNYVDMALAGLTGPQKQLPAGMQAYEPEYGCGVKY